MTKLNKFASLGMLCIIAENKYMLEEQSKLYGKLKRLEDLAMDELKNLPLVTGSERRTVGNRIVKFILDMGWAGQTKHIGTALSFALAMLEDVDVSPAIVETINSIIEHLENGGQLKQASCWSGSLAAERWDEIVKEK